MKYFDHRLWRVYENVTTVVGWGAIAAMIWVVAEALFSEFMPDWPILGEASYWLIGSIAWIFKADVVKYRITRDPRDHPIRKWFTLKNLKRHRHIRTTNKIVPSEAGGLIKTVCPSCNALHGFEKTEESSRVCGNNGCQEVIRAPHR